MEKEVCSFMFKWKKIYPAIFRLTNVEGLSWSAGWVWASLKCSYWDQRTLQSDEKMMTGKLMWGTVCLCSLCCSKMSYWEL